MSIQSNINQAISLTALLATQTSAYKDINKVNKLKTSIAKSQEGRSLLSPESSTYGEMLEAEKEMGKELYKTKPSQKTGEIAQGIYQEYREYNKKPLSNLNDEEIAEMESREESKQAYLDELMMNRADENLKNKQTTIRNVNQRKQGYMTPMAQMDFNRKEKRKLTTQIEQQEKEEKREAQRGEMNG